MIHCKYFRFDRLSLQPKQGMTSLWIPVTCGLDEGLVFSGSLMWSRTAPRVLLLWAGTLCFQKQGVYLHSLHENSIAETSLCKKPCGTTSNLGPAVILCICILKLAALQAVKLRKKINSYSAAGRKCWEIEFLLLWNKLITLKNISQRRNWLVLGWAVFHCAFGDVD